MWGKDTDCRHHRQAVQSEAPGYTEKQAGSLLGQNRKVYVLGAEAVTYLMGLPSPRDGGNRATVANPDGAVSGVGPVLPLLKQLWTQKTS